MDELERLEGAAAVHALADELGLEVGPIRVELMDDPARAERLMRYALARKSKLRNPTGFVVSKFRAGEDAPATRPAPPDEHEPLTIADLHGAVEFCRKVGIQGPFLDATQAALKVAHERGQWSGFTDADRERFALPIDPT